jgi:hypothetical protein
MNAEWSCKTKLLGRAPIDFPVSLVRMSRANRFTATVSVGNSPSNSLVQPGQSPACQQASYRFGDFLAGGLLVERKSG